MNEPNPNATPGEILVKETALGISAQAVLFAVSQSHGAAIINVGGIPIDQQEIAQRLPNYYHHVTVEEILNRQARIPADKRGLVVIGYTSGLYNDVNKEKKVEAFIRAESTERGVNSGRFAVLVLSDSMPNIDVFQNSAFPWFNGPFQSRDSVWSLRSCPSGIDLVSHERGKVSANRQTAEWVEKQAIPFRR